MQKRNQRNIHSEGYKYLAKNHSDRFGMQMDTKTILQAKMFSLSFSEILISWILYDATIKYLNWHLHELFLNIITLFTVYSIESLVTRWNNGYLSGYIFSFHKSYCQWREEFHHNFWNKLNNKLEKSLTFNSFKCALMVELNLPHISHT